MQQVVPVSAKHRLFGTHHPLRSDISWRRRRDYGDDRSDLSGLHAKQAREKAQQLSRKPLRGLKTSCIPTGVHPMSCHESPV